MFEKKAYYWIIFGAIILTFISYFSGLFIDVTHDCGKYATVAKEIFENKNFVNLTVHGEPYDQKPPLLFWLGALGFYIGGVSNFWFKFPIFLVVLLGFYSTYRLGKTMYSRKVGLLAATISFFSVIYLLYSMDVHTDTPLQAFAIFALWQLFEFIKTGKNIHWILGFTGIGLAMLSKGPIGGVVPAFAVIGHLILTKNYKSFTNFRWYFGIILAFIITSPALIGLYNQFGWEGIEFFFWKNNIGRLTGTYIKATNDPIFYIHNVLMLYIPWSVLFFISAFLDIKSLVRNRFKASEYFTFTGIWVFFIILNLSRSQLPNYMFILIPLISILTAKWIINVSSDNGKLYKLFLKTQNSIVVLLWIIILALSTYFFPYPKWYFILICFGLIGATFYVYKFGNSGRSKLILPTVIAFTALGLLMHTHIFPYIYGLQAAPKAAKLYNQEKKEGEKLFNFHYHQYELFFYTKTPAEQVHSIERIKEVAKNGNWVFTNPIGLDSIKAENCAIDTTITFSHFYLNQGGKFIMPATRHEVFRPLYLIKFK